MLSSSHFLLVTGKENCVQYIVRESCVYFKQSFVAREDYYIPARLRCLKFSKGPEAERRNSCGHYIIGLMTSPPVRLLRTTLTIDLFIAQLRANNFA